MEASHSVEVNHEEGTMYARQVRNKEAGIIVPGKGIFTKLNYYYHEIDLGTEKDLVDGAASTSKGDGAALISKGEDGAVATSKGDDGAVATSNGDDGAVVISKGDVVRG